MTLRTGAAQPQHAAAGPAALHAQLLSLMYMIENEVQPEVFSSIPVAMWWAIETLTTVGFLDQLKIYREHHPRTTVLVAGKSAVIAESLSAHVRAMTKVTARAQVNSEHGRGLAKQPGVCPHCGGATFASLPHDEAGNASVST